MEKTTHTVEERLDKLETLLYTVIDKLERPEKLVYNVDEAAEALNISTRLVYELMHQEDFPVSIKLRGRRVISRERLKEWVMEQAGGRKPDRYDREAVSD